MQLDIINIPSRSAVAWRGVANVLLGVIILAWPHITVYVVILFFALNIILVGLFGILEPLLNKKSQHNVLSVILGVLGVAFGAYLLIKPEFAATLIGIFIGFWALLFGIVDLVISAEAVKQKIDFAWSYVIIGVLSVLFGIYMLFEPLQGVQTFLWIVGVYVIIVGSILLLTSLFMKSQATTVKVKK
jgi:uncharacterized membrane protein HdeD (DUF308 family)